MKGVTHGNTIPFMKNLVQVFVLLCSLNAHASMSSFTEHDATYSLGRNRGDFDVLIDMVASPEFRGALPMSCRIEIAQDGESCAKKVSVSTVAHRSMTCTLKPGLAKVSVACESALHLSLSTVGLDGLTAPLFGREDDGIAKFHRGFGVSLERVVLVTE